MIMELDRTMGFLPECNLKQDFDTIRQKVQNVYDNQENIEYQSYEEIFTAKRMIEEINRFILPREIDWHDNYFYYGATTTMRDVQQDPIVEIAGIETTMPAERDFFDRIIEGEYKPEIIEGKPEENRTRENRIRENRMRENRVRENRQREHRVVEEMKFEEFE